MYKKVILFLFALFFWYGYISTGFAATVLNPWDIFPVIINAGSTDSLQLWTRVAIESGTVIYMSDNWWESSNTWRSREWYIGIVVNQDMPAGSIITLTSDLAGGGPTNIYPSSLTLNTYTTNTFSLNNAWDNFLIYQANNYNSLPPSFIYGWWFRSAQSWSSWVSAGATLSAQNSTLPNWLSQYINLNSGANFKYNCSNTNTSSPTFMNDINNPNNWSGMSVWDLYDVSSPWCNFTSSEAPLLSINLWSGQVDFTSGTLITFQVESTEPLDTATITCDDVILDGLYDSAVCLSVSEITPFDKTIFEIKISVNVGTLWYGDISLELLEGSVTSEEGIDDIGSLIDNNYVIIDNQPPVLTMNGSGVVTIEAWSIWSDPAASCTDNRDVSCSVIISWSVDTSTPGTYTITYTATDEIGNSSQVYRTVYVVNTNAPIITLNGSGVVTIEAWSIWSDPAASCLDNIDTTCVVIMSWSVNTNIPGTYMIHYTATDSDNNSSSITRTIYVVDTTAPQIQLNGWDIVSVEIWSTWSDPGALWSDSVDGSGVVYSFSWTINTNLTGIYTIEYRYIDAAGNSSSILTRTIYVKEEISHQNNGGWGGWYVLEKDLCPDGDRSPSYNDGLCQKEKVVDQTIFNPSIGTTCFTPGDRKTIYQWNEVSKAFRIAHQMLFSYELTQWQGTEDYRPFDYLTREEAARFMVEFAQNVLCRKPTRSYDNNFSDLDSSNPTLTKFIRESYDYGIFNGDNTWEGTSTTFRPKDRISNDELTAIMIRLVTSIIIPESGDDWAAPYRIQLASYAKVSSFNNSGRGNIAEVIYDLYRNNSYALKNIGYVIQ